MLRKKNDISLILNKNNTFLIIGASNNKEKYGNKIFNDLRKKGFIAIPININEKFVEGVKAYPSINDWLKNNDYDLNKIVLVFVVPPRATNNILKNIIQEKINFIFYWFQPGATNNSSNELINILKEKSALIIKDQCVMLSTI